MKAPSGPLCWDGLFPDILTEGKRPLVLFPEGALSNSNEHLNALQEGVSFIARSAAAKLDKASQANSTPDPRRVYTVPIAIRYLYMGDIEASAGAMLTQIEKRLSWRPFEGQCLIERIYRVGNALLSLKEQEYLGQSQSGDIDERLHRLLLTATGCIVAFSIMPQWRLSEQQATLISLGLLFVFGLCVSPCYYIPASVFSIDFGGPHSGFLVAILDAVGFAASAVFTVYGGHIAQSYGWGRFLTALIAVCIWSVLTTFFFMQREARNKRLRDA